MGVNRNFPRAYRHASKNFQGIGFPDTMVEQTFDMVIYCMLHGASNMVMGEAMRALVEQDKIEIGMGTPFIKIPFEKLVHRQPKHG